MENVKIPMEALADILQLQLQNGGRTELTVTGSSMHPMLHSGRDKVVLVQRPAVKYDVALYKRDSGAYILHRIVRVRDGLFLCTGDNQWELETIRPEQVIGVVDCWYSNGKLKTTKNIIYKMYVWSWGGLLYVRRPFLAVRRVLGKLNRKIKRRKSHG